LLLGQRLFVRAGDRFEQAHHDAFRKVRRLKGWSPIKLPQDQSVGRGAAARTCSSDQTRVSGWGFGQKLGIAMSWVGADVPEEVMDIVGRPFQRLKKPSSMGDQQARDVPGSIVKDRGCEDLLDIFFQILQAIGVARLA
jgi:hypothetical protein